MDLAKGVSEISNFKIIFVFFFIFGSIIIILIVLKLYFRGGVCRVRKNLSGKVAVITGGNAGLGKETI